MSRSPFVFNSYKQFQEDEWIARKRHHKSKLRFVRHVPSSSSVASTPDSVDSSSCEGSKSAQLPDLTKSSSSVIPDSEETSPSEVRLTSPVLQRRSITSSSFLSEDAKLPDHKIILVQPLSSEEEQQQAEYSENPLGGMSIKEILSSSSTSASNERISEDSPIFRGHANKRMRADSDSDCNDSQSFPKKLNMSNSGSDEKTSIVMDAVPVSDEILEKYIDTLQSLYESYSRMEILDILKNCSYNFGAAAKELARTFKEHKIKKNQEERKQKQLMKMKQKRTDILRAKIKHWQDVEVDEDEDDAEDDILQIRMLNVYDSDAASDEDEDDCHDENGKADKNLLQTMRTFVLNFFNEATLHEISFVPGFSKKKTEIIMELRPFSSFADLVYKFKNVKHISVDLLNSAKNVIAMRKEVQSLMDRCEKIALRINSVVSAVLDGIDDETGIKEQPSMLNQNLRLKGYQMIGLNWLLLLHKLDLNGVLADEMGLGKTIQAIAFLAHLKEIDYLTEVSLIVVPSSTIDNWSRELELWCPALEVMVYHGSQEDRKGLRMDIINGDADSTDIILTAYNMVTSSPEDRGLFKKMKFNTIIFDEAHFLKNMSTQRYETLMRIRGRRKVLLTGTPLQNNLVELMSILVFVMPRLFHGKRDALKQAFSVLPKGESRSKFEEEKIEQAKNIMKPFFLRRLKSDVLKDLPEKTEKVFYIDMLPFQMDLYDTRVSDFNRRGEETCKKINEMEIKELETLQQLEALSPEKTKEKKILSDSSAHILMCLRKIANHPLLVRNHYNNKVLKEIAKILKRTTHQDSVLQYIVEDLSVMNDFEIHKTCCQYASLDEYKLTDEKIAGSGKLNYFDEILPVMFERGDRVLVFSQFVIVLNILEEYLKIRGYKYLRMDGATQVMERQELIDQFNEDSNYFIFLLSTRAGGLGINLTAANTVIIHDVDFNPYNDKQAEDRCHRVGQCRPVNVIRLISKNTIEEGMLEIAQKKLQLEQDITGNTDETHSKQDMVHLLKKALGLAQLDELQCQGGSAPHVRKPSGDVL